MVHINMKKENKKREQLIEVCRSFSYKLNAGHYETRDFFCSQKAEVSEEEAEKTSEKLYEFCKSEVIKSVNSYLEEMRLKKLEGGTEKAPDYKPKEITEEQVKKIDEDWQKKYNQETQLQDIKTELQQS